MIKHHPSKRRWIVSLAAAAALGLGLARAGAADRDLMAQGGPVSDTAKPLWVVPVENDSQGDRSGVLMREELGSRWVQLEPIRGRVVGLAAQSTELVLMLRSPGGQVHDWAWYSSARFSFGPVLPQQSEILAMAGDRSALWALGRTAPESNGAATHPASQPATAPSTQPAGPAPTVYSLEQGAWAAHKATWPAGLQVGDRESVSMVLIDEPKEKGRAGVPYVAVRSAPDRIRVLKLEGDRWAEVFAPLHLTPSGAVHFKLLNLLNHPAVWVLWDGTDDKVGRAGQLWTGPDKVIKLELPAVTNASPPTPRRSAIDLTVSGDQIHLFYLRKEENGGEKLYQQIYSAAGERRSDAEQVKPVRYGSDADRDMWKWMAGILVVSIVLVNLVLRRRQAAREDNRSDYEE